MNDLINNVNKVHNDMCILIDNPKCKGNLKLITGQYVKGIICLNLKHKDCNLFKEYEKSN